MKHPKLLWRGLAFVIALTIIGCANQQTKSSKGPQKNMPVVKESKEVMRFAFTNPVVMVNGIRPVQNEDEYEEKIEVSYPQDSTKDITLLVMVEGEEKTLKGQIEVFHYTEFSKAEKGDKPELVSVTPSNPELAYGDIVHHGYGEFTVREKIHEETGERVGAVVAKLRLGTKKKTGLDQIEFQFAEEVADTVNGGKTPVALSFPAETRHDIEMTMDQGEVILRGELQVYKPSEYTKWAPIWIAIPEETKEYLRARGGQAEIVFSVPTTAPVFSEEYVKVMESGRDPSIPAREQGKTIVALLKLRRLNQ